MSRDRHILIQLLAQGRIDPAQAERLIAALGADRETAWAMAGCAVIVGMAQLRYFAPPFVHLLSGMLVEAAPVLHHAFSAMIGCV